jgi:hypothetical protein
MKPRTARTAYLVERDQSDSDSTDSAASYARATREPRLEKPAFSRSQTMPMRKPQDPSDANTAMFRGSKLKHAGSFDNGRPGVDRPGL